MPPESEKFEIPLIDIAKARRNPWAVVKMIGALMLLGGAAWTWHAGYRPANLFGKAPAPVRFVEIDSGDIDLVVVESGTIKNAQQRDRSLPGRGVDRAGRRHRSHGRKRAWDHRRGWELSRRWV